MLGLAGGARGVDAQRGRARHFQQRGDLVPAGFIDCENDAAHVDLGTVKGTPLAGFGRGSEDLREGAGEGF